MTNGHFHQTSLVWFTSLPNVNIVSQHLQQCSLYLQIYAKVTVWRHRVRYIQ